MTVAAADSLSASWCQHTTLVTFELMCPAASARQLALARWGNQVVTRAAHTVIERVGELDPALRLKLHEATAGAEDGDDAA